jgi:hypothetical protein
MPLGPGEHQWIVQHPGAVVQRLDGLHVFGFRGEVEHVQVLGDPLGLGRCDTTTFVQLQVAANLVEAGCSSIWFTAGTWEVSSITVDKCSSVKFETPIDRT